MVMRQKSQASWLRSIGRAPVPTHDESRTKSAAPIARRTAGGGFKPAAGEMIVRLIERNTTYAAISDAVISSHPPDAGHDVAVKLSSCFDPISGG